MYRKEALSVFSIGLIVAFRMLGLFMILPIFSVAASKLPGANASLIGIALGVYGLTQACLQIPFGTLSDRLGRKPVIAWGLALFAFGSVIAAMSTSIMGIIIGRAVQGAGAIGSTCLALIADLTRDENRTKAMASVGMTIGLAFCIAIIIGPLLDAHFGLSGLFWFTALLALCAFAILFIAVPNPPRSQGLQPVTSKDYRRVFAHRQLQYMNVSIFIQHAILTILFIALPIIFTQQLRLSGHQQTLFYLVVIILAFLAMIPLIIIGEKKRKLRGVLLFSIAMIGISQFLARFLTHNVISTGIILFLFFMAFTLLESIMPSLVSKISPIALKGTAMGLYSTSQFAGIFIGGVFGGIVLNHFSLTGLFTLTSVLSVIWFLLLFNMAQPPYFSTLIIPFKDQAPSVDLVDKLKSHPGVSDAMVSPNEKLIYIKADKQLIRENELRNTIEQDSLSNSA